MAVSKQNVYVVSLDIKTGAPFAFAQSDIPYGVACVDAINARGGNTHIYEARLCPTPADAIRVASPSLFRALERLRQQRVEEIEAGVQRCLKTGSFSGEARASKYNNFSTAACTVAERKRPNFIKRLVERARTKLILWQYN